MVKKEPLKLEIQRIEESFSCKGRKPLTSDQRRRADGLNGSDLMVGSQPVSSTATGLTNERICCCRPLRTCPSATAIITVAATLTRALFEHRADNIVYDETGRLHCQCPQTA